jgi:MFS family permease
MLLVGRLMEHIDCRVLLAAGLLLTTAGLAMLAATEPTLAVPWLIAGGTLQAIGTGMLFTCLTTAGFSTLPPAARTDATGVYSLLRQIGCGSGVVLMIAVLRATLGGAPAEPLLSADGLPLEEYFEQKVLDAYRTCFRVMAIAALVTTPGVWLFRMPRLAVSFRGEAGPQS